MLAQRVERFWWRDLPPPRWMQPLAELYQWVNRRNLMRRARRAVEPPLPVIFVGNITVGGSGKTPFVLALAAALKLRGAKPVIACRGDGGRLRQPRRVTPDAAPDLVGDEALMMAQAASVPVIAGRDRVAAAALAATLGDVMILDDGLQYLKLARTAGRSCDVVLLPGAGVGNGALLPIGPLREPLSALARADIIVISGDGDPSALLDAVRDTPRFHWRAAFGGLDDVMATNAPLTPCAIHLVTAIARPHRVVAMLEAEGFVIACHSRFSDHHRYRARDVARLCRRPEPVVTTMKDAVKLKPLWPDGRPLWVCRQRLQIEEALLERIWQAIGGKPRTR